MLLSAGANDDAVKVLARAIQLAPGDAEARALQGKAFLALRRYRSAIEDLDEAVRLDPALKTELAPQLEELKTRRE